MSFSDDFIQANANKEFICAEFTEVFRDLFRAIAIIDDPGAAVSRATYRMRHVADLLKHCDEDVSFHDLFTTAVSQIRQWDPIDRIESATLDAARAGVSVLAEASCIDNGARGRTRQRERRFFDAIKRIEIARNNYRP